MIAVIFELEAKLGHQDQYLEIAKMLFPILEEAEGFISVERFQSLTHPEKLLSLSYWRDEDCIKKWRNTEKHRQAQKLGRSSIFANYRLRIATVIRSYGLQDRDQAPLDSIDYHSSKQ